MNQGQTQFHVPQLTFINKILIFTHVGLFLLNSLLNATGAFSLSPYLGLSGVMFFKGHIYQLLTYGLLGTSVFEVLFNCLILWFIGSELESLWQRKRYGFFLAGSVLGGGLIFLILQLIFFSGSMMYGIPLHGMGGMTYALLLGYAILFPNRMLYLIIFPVKAKYFCLILICMQLYYGVFTPKGVQAWGHLGSMACGYLCMLIMSSPRFRHLFESGGAGKPSKRRSQHLKLVKEEDDDDNDPAHTIH